MKIIKNKNIILMGYNYLIPKFILGIILSDP